METKKEQAREVSCSVRVQTDDHSGTNTVHAVRDEPRKRTAVQNVAFRVFFSCVFFLLELGKMNERVQRETKKTHAVA